MFNLSDEQESVIDGVVYDAEARNRVTVVTGHAGTGKTVILLRVANRTGFHVAAPTNKAAKVITNKAKAAGLDITAKTIHSIVMTPFEVIGSVKEAEGIYAKTYNGSKLDDREELLVQPVFMERKEKEPCAGVIIDEASMLTKELYHIVLSMKIPVILFGDPGQLKPVDKYNPGWSAIAEHDYHLSEVFRNGGDILDMATHIRNGGIAKRYKPSTGGNVRLATGRRDLVGFQPDVTLAYKNATVFGLNNQLRYAFGQTTFAPVAGDKLVMECRLSGTNLIKSSIVTVLSTKEPEPYFNRVLIKYQSDDDEKIYESYFDWSYFSTAAPKGQPKSMAATIEEWEAEARRFENLLKKLNVNRGSTYYETIANINRRQRELLGDESEKEHAKYREIVMACEAARRFNDCAKKAIEHAAEIAQTVFPHNIPATRERI
jgi:exodeoxyribonuclease-5